MGVASLVLGIVSIVFAILGLGIPVGVIAGLVGVILGAVGKGNPASAGMAKAGLVCSIIGTILSLLVFIACASCLASAGLMW